ncbi:MAG: hypothetical protein V1816_07810 [Pseudomonadota bacterium]
MKKKSFAGRFLLPLTLCVGVMLISGFFYHSAPDMARGPVRTVMVEVFGPLLFLSIWFFPLVGPPLAFFGGASFPERMIIAFANPVIWIARMEALVACQYTPLELVYFFFLPWTFGNVCVTLALFSLAEFSCRIVAVGTGRAPGLKILAPGVLLMLVLGGVGLYFGLIRGQEWVYLVVHHYAAHVL